MARPSLRIVRVASFLALAAAMVGVAVSRVAAEEETPWYETITNILNDPLVEAAEEEAKDWVRSQIVTEEDMAGYGLKMDEGWDQKDARLPVIVMVHGFQSKAENAEGLLHLVREAGYPCGNFTYPNDDMLPPSGALLARELGNFSQQHPGRRLVLVCHSMGGLVARVCLEDPKLDPGTVERLIMVAPPSHGSMLSYLAAGADAWEHIIGHQDGMKWENIRLTVVDGMGDAAIQLRPGSRFLQELNARPRNPRVKYTIILGSKGYISVEDMQQLRNRVGRTLGNVPVGLVNVKRVDEVLADMDEIVRGKGDGAVAVSRGRLEGVDDTHILPFDHLGVVGPTDDKVVHQVHEIILERIK